MYVLQVFDIADNFSGISIKDGHHVVAQMRNVEPPGLRVEALIIEARGSSGQRHIGNGAERQFHRLGCTDREQSGHEHNHNNPLSLHSLISPEMSFTLTLPITFTSAGSSQCSSYRVQSEARALVSASHPEPRSA